MNMQDDEAIKLVQEGSVLIEKARDFSFKNFERGDIYTALDFVLCDYRDWKERVIKILGKEKENEVNVLNIINHDTLFINATDWAKKAINHDTKTEAVKLYIENINEIIKMISSNARLVINQVNNDSNKIKITISSEGIYRIKDGKKLKYKIKQTGKRGKLVNLLFESDESRDGADLMRRFAYASKELLGKEIGQINGLFFTNLNIKGSDENYLILNHQNGNGYFLNREKYIFE